jgi:hypothetical protein
MRIGRTLVAAVGIVLALAGGAEAQALRRFEDAHHEDKPSSNSSSSSSSNDSSSKSSSSRSSGHSSVGSAIVGEIFSSLFSGTSSSSSSSPSSEPDIGRSPSYRPSAVIYGGRSSAYIRPYRLEEDTGLWKRTADPVRYAELRVGGFAAAGERVYSHDLALAGWLGLFTAQGAWERLYEPRPELSSVDTLDLFRAHIGPNILGSSVKPVELYLLVGGAGLYGQRGLTPAFDGAIQARVYPVRPLAFYSSVNVSIFGQGPPLLDGRFEMGASVGRFDLRAGVRGLRQDPAQSFFGPVATVSLRM